MAREAVKPNDFSVKFTFTAPDGNTYGNLIETTIDDPNLMAMCEKVVRYARYQFGQAPRPEWLPSFADDSKIPLGKLDDQ